MENVSRDQNEAVHMEMPKYRCHKEVHALKIKRLYQGPDGYTWFEPEEPGYVVIRLPLEYVTKHNPQPGGYYVVYEDGYKSWSPASAFESGCSPI